VLRHLLPHLLAHRVSLLRLVEDDPADRAVLLKQELLAHERSPRRRHYKTRSSVAQAIPRSRQLARVDESATRLIRSTEAALDSSLGERETSDPSTRIAGQETKGSCTSTMDGCAGSVSSFWVITRKLKRLFRIRS